jgi:hypothetical protein
MDSRLTIAILAGLGAAGCGGTFAPCGSHQAGVETSEEVLFSRNGEAKAMQVECHTTFGRTTCGSGSCGLPSLQFYLCSPAGRDACFGIGVALNCKFRDPNAMYVSGVRLLSEACSSLILTDENVGGTLSAQTWEGTLEIGGTDEQGSAVMNLDATDFASADGQDRATLSMRGATFAWRTVADDCSVPLW